jgi:hypothetical protein
MKMASGVAQDVGMGKRMQDIVPRSLLEAARAQVSEMPI